VIEMGKRVLSVGQCGPDHAAISGLLQSQFGAQVDRAALGDEALAKVDAVTYDLILVNRKLDADYSDGLEVIRALRQSAAGKTVPVMLVSNYPEAHAEAVAEGAVPGFGKDSLRSAGTIALLAPFLEA
jgi:CheY-like chemotaxis protein